MKLLIIGATGQMAHAFSQTRHPDTDIICMGRAKLDISSPSQIANRLDQIKPDLVINTAAYTDVDRAEQEPEKAYQLNADGARDIAIETERLSCPIIQLSTDYVFDGIVSTDYSEADATAPLNTYGASKLAGEKAVIAANPKHLIIRTSWIYSPIGKNFVKTMLRLARTKDRIEVVEDQFGRPTSASDLATALVQISKTVLNSQADVRGIYHLAGSGSASWADFASAIFSDSQALDGPSASVHPIKTANFPTPARRPLRAVLDCGKAEAVFGVTLPPWRSGLKQCVQDLLGSDT